MLRYMARGPRNFLDSPVPPMPRLNWEFYVVTGGHCGPLLPAEKSPNLRTRTMWILPPHTVYGWRGDGRPCDRVVFHFGMVAPDLVEILSGKKFLAVPLDADEIARIYQLADDVMPHLEHPHQFSHLLFERAALDLTIIAVKNQPTRSEIPLHRLASERVERALAWYLVNMARNPTVAEVANTVNVTPTHLRRLFRTVRHCSPHRAFRELQLQRATSLLTTTSLTLDQIASQCGFCSITDFSRVFHKEMNTTADQWRRHIVKQEKNEPKNGKSSRRKPA